MRNSAKNPIVKYFKNKEGVTIGGVRKTDKGYLGALNRSLIEDNQRVSKHCATKTEAWTFVLEKAREIFGEDQISLRA